MAIKKRVDLKLRKGVAFVPALKDYWHLLGMPRAIRLAEDRFNDWSGQNPSLGRVADAIKPGVDDATGLGSVVSASYWRALMREAHAAMDYVIQYIKISRHGIINREGPKWLGAMAITQSALPYTSGQIRSFIIMQNEQLANVLSMPLQPCERFEYLLASPPVSEFTKGFALTSRPDGVSSPVEVFDKRSREHYFQLATLYFMAALDAELSFAHEEYSAEGILEPVLRIARNSKVSHTEAYWRLLKTRASKNEGMKNSWVSLIQLLADPMDMDAGRMKTEINRWRKSSDLSFDQMQVILQMVYDPTDYVSHGLIYIRLCMVKILENLQLQLEAMSIDELNRCLDRYSYFYQTHKNRLKEQ